jgi:hypothetical protein
MVAEVSDTSQRLGRIYMWQGTDYITWWVGYPLSGAKQTFQPEWIYVRYWGYKPL